MARLPDYTALGQSPTPQPGRQIVSYRGGIAEEAQADIGVARARFGQQLTKIIDEHEDAKDKLETARASAAFYRAKAETEVSFENDPDYATYTPRYLERMKGAADQAAQMISNPRARALFEAGAERLASEGLGKIARLGRTKETDAAKGDLARQIDEGADAMAWAPDDATRTGLRDSIWSQIDAARQKGYLSEIEAVTWRKKFAETTSLARFRNLPADERLRITDAMLGQNSAAGTASSTSGGTIDPNNVGNIRASGGGFRAYATPEEGVAATIQNARSYPDRFNGGRPMSLIEIANRWAPRGDGDNDPDVWAKNVADAMGVDPADKIDLNDPQRAAAFARGVHRQEKGGKALFDDSVYARGADRAAGPAVAAVLRAPSEARTVAAAGPVSGDGGLRKLGDWTDFLPLGNIRQYNEEALRDIRTSRAGLTAAVTAQLRDFTAAAKSGSSSVAPPDPAVIRAAYPPDQAEQIIAEIPREQQLASDLQSLALATPEQVAAMDARLKPSGEGFAEAAERYRVFRSALDQDMQARRADPAAYVITKAPQLQSAIQAAGDNPAALQAALAQSDTLQAQIGIPAYDRRLLTRAQAADIAKSIATASPEQWADRLEAAAAQFGPMWPRVYGELVREKLPKEATVVATLTRPTQAAARVQLVEALKLGEGALKDIVGTDAVKSIDENVRAGMADFTATLGPQGRNGALSLALTDSARLLAMQYARTSTPSAAAERAVQEIVGEAYSVADGYRVPREYDLDAVRTRASNMMGMLKPEDVEAFSSRFENVPEENRRGSAYNAAQRGQWITNEDETGLIRLNEHGEPVVLSREIPGFSRQQPTRRGPVWVLTVPFVLPEGAKEPVSEMIPELQWYLNQAPGAPGR